MKFIESGWNSYRKLLPAGAPQIQVDETRRAFYAGAAVIFNGLITIMDGGDEPTAADMRRMADIQEEVDAFGRELDQHVFGKIWEYLKNG